MGGLAALDQVLNFHVWLRGAATVSHCTETTGPELYVNTADKLPLIESFK